MSKKKDAEKAARVTELIKEQGGKTIFGDGVQAPTLWSPPAEWRPYDGHGSPGRGRCSVKGDDGKLYSRPMSDAEKAQKKGGKQAQKKVTTLDSLSDEQFAQVYSYLVDLSSIEEVKSALNKQKVIRDVKSLLKSNGIDPFDVF